MPDRRVHARYGVRIAGKLMSPDMTFCVDVVVRNLSESGALISALAPIGSTPERVYLWQAQTRTLFECRVEWIKNGRLLGLRFTEDCSRSSLRNLLDAAVPGRRARQPGMPAPVMPMRGPAIATGGAPR